MTSAITSAIGWQIQFHSGAGQMRCAHTCRLSLSMLAGVLSTSILGSDALAVDLISSRAAALRPVLVEGERAVGVPGMEINDVSWPQVNEAGDVLIHANLRTGTPEPGPGPAIYIEQNGQIRLVTVIGAPAPANPPGVTFFNGFGNTVLNNVGQVAFRSQVPDQSRGVWIWTDGQIEEVARTGTPLSDWPGGEHFVATKSAVQRQRCHGVRFENRDAHSNRNVLR